MKHLVVYNVGVMFISEWYMETLFAGRHLVRSSIISSGVFRRKDNTMSEDKIIDDKELEKVSAGASSNKKGSSKSKGSSKGKTEKKTNF